MEEEYKLAEIMKKNIKIRKNLNDIILRLNNSSFMLILIAYLGLLLLATIIITPRKSYVIVPNYDHIIYPDEIVPQITLVALRSKETDGKISLRYNVTAKLSGRLNQDKVDPKYPIDRFQMSANLTNNKMYYFTEQKDRTTAISHTYTMTSTEIEDNIPSTFFTKLHYRDQNGEKKIGSFKEEIMVERPNGNYTTNNKITHTESDKVIKDLEISFIAKKEESRYLVSVWINVEDLTKKYHVDMQTWIITEDGKELPFMGVYGYSDQRNSFYLSNREVINDLKPKDLYCRLNYYLVNDEGKVETKTINYKEAFSKLPSQYGQNPNIEPEPIVTPKEFKWVPWAVGAVIIVIGAFGTIYYFTKKRKKEKSV